VDVLRPAAAVLHHVAVHQLQKKAVLLQGVAAVLQVGEVHLPETAGKAHPVKVDLPGAALLPAAVVQKKAVLQDVLPAVPLQDGEVHQVAGNSGIR